MGRINRLVSSPPVLNNYFPYFPVDDCIYKFIKWKMMTNVLFLFTFGHVCKN